jgi:hypothetical protein
LQPGSLGQTCIACGHRGELCEKKVKQEK